MQLHARPTEMAARWLARCDVATWTHPERDCTYDEAEACIRHGKDRPEVIREHIARIRADGFPAHAGLVSAGFMLRRNTPPVQALCEAWWAQLASGSIRDQLSFNYAAWKLGFPYLALPHYPLPGTEGARYVTMHGHRLSGPQIGLDPAQCGYSARD
jgi:hypothetical protein